MTPQERVEQALQEALPQIVDSLKKEKKAYLRTDCTKCEYITPNKQYEVQEWSAPGELAQIVADTGNIITVYTPSSCHIDDNPWEVVYE